MKITLEKGQRLFFTSDTHYAHSNICSATTNWTESSNMTREFNSLDKMNATLVNNINCMVGEDDILIHLGDWSFGGFDKIEEFRSQINCKNQFNGTFRVTIFA
jgi:calcineurin-like phosphoesterase family protein